MEDTSEIRKILDDLTQYLFNKDRNAIMDLLDTDIHHFGTGAIEDYSSHEGIAHHLDQSFSVDNIELVDYKIINLKKEENTAWSSLEWNAKFTIDGIEIDYPQFRNTFVFRKRNIGWKIVQWHASVPEIGTEGSIGKIRIDQLQIEIQNLVDRIGLDVESKGELEKVRDYLMQAKSIAKSLN